MCRATRPPGAWLRETASYCPCTLFHDPNGEGASLYSIRSRDRHTHLRSSIEAGLTEDRSASRTLDLVPAMSGLDLLLLPKPLQATGCAETGFAVIPRGSRKALPAAFHFVSALWVRIASGLTTAIEVAMGAASENRRNEIMATIGTITSTGNGFSGAITTLNPTVKAKLVRIENPSDKGPSLPHQFGQCRAGCGLAEGLQRGPRLPPAELHDPSFPVRIYATLIEVDGEEGLQLIWSRPNRD